jgi:hypothetical protein
MLLNSQFAMDNAIYLNLMIKEALQFLFSLNKVKLRELVLVRAHKSSFNTEAIFLHRFIAVMINLGKTDTLHNTLALKLGNT